jgi:hypothetical protein
MIQRKKLGVCCCVAKKMGIHLGVCAMGRNVSKMEHNSDGFSGHCLALPTRILCPQSISEKCKIELHLIRLYFVDR